MNIKTIDETRKAALIAFRFVKQRSMLLPGWARRRCRREAICLCREAYASGDRASLDVLRESVKLWRKTPWRNLPPDLPRREGESDREYIKRCYEAWDLI